MKFPAANDVATKAVCEASGQPAPKSSCRQNDIASVNTITNRPISFQSTGQSVSPPAMGHSGCSIERPSEMIFAQENRAPEKLNARVDENQITLPNEMMMKIIGYLDLADLTVVALLGEDMRQLAVNSVKFRHPVNLYNQLFQQVMLGNTQALQFCHDAGVNLTDLREPHQGRTLFMDAVRLGQLAIMDMLINLSAANPTAQDNGKRNALHYAVLNDNFTVLKRVITLPRLDVDATDDDGATPLHYAASLNKCGYVNMIIRHQIGREFNDEVKADAVAHIDGKTSRLSNARHVESNPIGLIDANAADKIGFTALHKALYLARTDFFERLLAIENIEVNAPDGYGATLLHHAAVQASTKWLKLLLPVENIKLNVRQDYGCTPLYLAVAKKRTKTVALLLEWAPVEPNIPDNCGLTPLHRAVADGYLAAVDLLLERLDTDVDARNAQGCSPLHIAALYGYGEIADRLINGGASINICQNDGWTPLHCAVMKGHFHIVERLLLHRKIDIDVKDNSRRVPADYAALNGQSAMVKLLDSASARRKTSNGLEGQ